ncbi:MAG: glycosyltransferase family 39 protein [Cyanosarcina radialis HA8281-LM2]|jgi:uncharacterized membrane protein|nr:glycosyltransferase family 39 protein [Cyanosarcina radialis HA8281-LM2]
MLTKLARSQKRIWVHLLLLGLWLAIGTILRFANLDLKHLWNDEIATLVFSLGNSFNSVPFDRLIDLDTLLQPLQPRPEAGVRDVVRHLMAESTHPPVFFVLNHLWLKLFPTSEELVSVWAGRSLSAIFGIISIPAMFALGSFAFRSLLVGQIAAAMMAVSPYGIYLAQEARHYTLTILFVIASIACLIKSIETIENRTPLPLWIGSIWVVINSLGIATHYFFVIALGAEALVLFKFWLIDCGSEIWQKLRSLTYQNRSKKSSYSPPLPLSPSPFLSQYWLRLYAVAMGTAIAGWAWLPTLQRVSDNELTKWIFAGHSFTDLLSPIIRLLAWLLTMVVLLPVEGVPQSIAIASLVTALSFIIWVLWILLSTLKTNIQRSTARLSTQVLSDLIFASIAIFLGITYIIGADLTIVGRYHFIYFPTVIIFLASYLAVCWRDRERGERRRGGDGGNFLTQNLSSFFKNKGKRVVILMLVMGFAGGLTVISNFGFQKTTHPDILVAKIQQISRVPVALAIFHQTPHEVRVLMELGLQLKSLPPNSNFPQFILAHQGDNPEPPSEVIDRAIAPIPRPLDLWLINSGVELESKLKNCSPYFPKTQILFGHHHQLYQCR